MLHFAYGSNMDRASMRRRCPTATALGAARLDHWRFLVTRDGYGSVAPAPGDVVHGVLWRLAPRDLAAVNAYESVDSGLYRRCMLSVRRGGRRVQALVYVARDRRAGRPRPGYQDLVVRAARDWSLPEDYVRRLERWSAGRALSSPRGKQEARSVESGGRA
jgi:cation transport regulator ChaC